MARLKLVLIDFETSKMVLFQPRLLFLTGFEELEALRQHYFEFGLLPERVELESIEEPLLSDCSKLLQEG